MNTFGRLFRITSFGESHGPALGVIIDGVPAGLHLSISDIQAELDRRRPGQSDVTTPRAETDQAEILSGVFEGKTTGAPVAIIVYNHDIKSQDYDALKDVYRPSHADFSYQQKYAHRDHRGGGRSSARETIARVMGGAVAKKILQLFCKTSVWGFTQAISSHSFATVDKSFIEKNVLRMADPKQHEAMLAKVMQAKIDGDSLGGVVEIRVDNPPAGLGSPVFGKIEGELARACLSIPGIKGFAIGEGFALSQKKGSEANDPWVTDPDGNIKTKRNANGGILGGISTGETIWFRVAVKPTSSISKSQTTVNKKGQSTDLKIKGRHDPILLPRAIPILEAMTALVLVDNWLLQQTSILPSA